MNKLIVFMLGSCSTFSIHLGLMYVNWWDMLFTHAMSLVGGVVHIPVDTRSAFPVISVQSPVSIQYRWQS